MGRARGKKLSGVLKPRWLKTDRGAGAPRATIGLVKKFVAVFEGRKGVAELYATVAGMFRHFSSTQKRVAVLALGKVLIDHPEKHTRWKACNCLKRHGGRAGVKALKKSALTDKDETIRLLSFQGVVEIEGAKDIDTIKRVIINDGSIYVRSFSVDAICRAKNIPKETKIALLTDALREEIDGRVRTMISGHKGALEAGKEFNPMIGI